MLSITCNPWKKCINSIGVGFLSFKVIIKCDALKKLDKRFSLQMYNILANQSLVRSLNLSSRELPSTNHCLQVPQDL